MAKDKSKKPERGTGGALSVRTFGGLNEQNFAKGVGFGDRFKFEKRGKPYAVQFLFDCSDEQQWLEFWQHQFPNGKSFSYVPCLGDDCPLCEDDDELVKKRNYRFLTNIYSFKDKKVVLLEGPKDLSSRIFRRFESVKKAKKKDAKPFTERVYALTQNDTQPVSYDVELAEEDPKKVKTSEAHDLRKYIDAAAQRYFGGSPSASKKTDKKKGKSALDAAPTQEDSYTESQLKGMSEKKLFKAARSYGIDPEGVEPAKLIKKILKKQG